MASDVHLIREVRADRDLPERWRRFAGGRHVNHDPRSRAFPHRANGRQLVTTLHSRSVGPFDQGEIGSCVGNAMLGALLTAPLDTTWGQLADAPTRDEAGAVALYSAATAIDPYPGTYLPTDSGSDGLSVAKVAQRAGLIAGYRHALTLADALDALLDGPVITGVTWTEGMFSPDTDGRVRPGGRVAGGHEFCVTGFDVEAGRVWCTNSWGAEWGVVGPVAGGRSWPGQFYLTFADWSALLADDGDVTIPVPLTEPTPVPTPVPGRYRVGTHVGLTIYDEHAAGAHDEKLVAVALRSKRLAARIVDLLNIHGGPK